MINIMKVNHGWIQLVLNVQDLVLIVFLSLGELLIGQLQANWQRGPFQSSCIWQLSQLDPSMTVFFQWLLLVSLLHPFLECEPCETGNHLLIYFTS